MIVHEFTNDFIILNDRHEPMYLIRGNCKMEDASEIISLFDNEAVDLSSFSDVLNERIYGVLQRCEIKEIGDATERSGLLRSCGNA